MPSAAATIQNMLDFLYSPLPRQYCLYYYLIMVFAFVVFVVAFAGAFLGMINKANSKSVRGILTGIFGVLAISLPMFIGYFQARLMYSVCDAAMK